MLCYHLGTKGNINMLKITLHRSHKDKQYTNVSRTKRNTKIHFCMPQTFGANLYYFHTTYRLHFWPTFSPQGIQTINYRLFYSLFTHPPELKKEFWALTLYKHTDRCTDANDHIYLPSPNLVHPLPQKQCKYNYDWNVLNMRSNIQYLDVWGAFPSFWWYLS